MSIPWQNDQMPLPGLPAHSVRQCLRNIHAQHAGVLVDSMLDALLGIDAAQGEQYVQFSALENTYGREQYCYQDTRYDVIRAAIQHLHLDATDVFYDLGAGYGRVVMYAALTTAARCKGIEILPHRVAAARTTQAQLALDNVEIIHGNVVHQSLHDGTAFFVFNPFTPATLYLVRHKLHAVALAKPIRLASIGMCTDYFRQQSWLEETATAAAPPGW